MGSCGPDGGSYGQARRPARNALITPDPCGGSRRPNAEAHVGQSGSFERLVLVLALFIPALELAVAVRRRRGFFFVATRSTCRFASIGTLVCTRLSALRSAGTRFLTGIVFLHTQFSSR